jgi:hypothetical protein
MLNVANYPFMLNVVMLSVIMLSVVAPRRRHLLNLEKEKLSSFLIAFENISVPH